MFSFKGLWLVVVVSPVATHGVEYLFATVVLMAILQIIFGLLKLGNFVRIVLESVIYGFDRFNSVSGFLAVEDYQSISGSTEWYLGSIRSSNWIWS